MKRSIAECAYHRDPTADDEFWKDLFRVRTLESAEKGEALGFTATDREQTVTGIRFTPMQYDEQEGVQVI